MNDQLRLLQELNTLLTEYANGLTVAATQPPNSIWALQKVYGLQSDVARDIYALLLADSSKTSAKTIPKTQTDPLIRELKNAIIHRRLEGIDNVVGDFEKLYTILGPNKFPDDD